MTGADKTTSSTLVLSQAPASDTVARKAKPDMLLMNFFIGIDSLVTDILCDVGIDVDDRDRHRKQSLPLGDRIHHIRITGIEEGEESQLKGPENIFNKIIEENFPNLKEEMVIKVQEAYRTPN